MASDASDPLTTEAWVSVDVEAAGPHPSRYSLLSIGACLVDEPDQEFYVELRPVSMESIPEAMTVNGLSMVELNRSATPPERAMSQFREWLARAVPAGRQPRFVGFNAPFDWMFVNDYFHRFLGANPFGHAALDIKSFYMGLTGVRWEQTSFRDVAGHYGVARRLTHNALNDARDQAALFRQMLEEANR